jgi:plastocyanin
MMKSKRQLGWALVALMLMALGTGNLLAQSGENSGIPTNIGYPSNPPGTNNPGAPPNAGSPTYDPPARVARIQYISGEVSLQPGGVNDWVAADLNRPLTTSDRVWTDKNSKVELNVGNAFLRMDSESSLTFTNVGDNTIQAELDQGVVELTVLHLEPGEIFEVDTPNLAFTVMKAGVYRIDVRPNDDQTWVTVRKGNGQATGNGPAVKVSSGDQVRFTAQNSLQHEAYAAPAPDGFEDWAQVRDKRLDGAESARYVAPGTIGYQDLDYYGRWQVVPTYGAVWVPTSVPAGWAPYRYGHWVWVAPWGWTWVDNAPWGFAPFHYGRWVSFGGYWGWAPGPAYVGWRPYYAPALVGWVGGAGWGFGISFGVGFGIGGGCGWFPLGWGEAYYPWYHGYRGGYVSQAYIRNVNITNTHITNITNVTNNYYNNSVNNAHYANRSVAGAVTAAPKSALANGQNIAKVGMAVPQSDLAKGQVMRSIDVTPTKAAMLGGHTATGSAVPPRSAIDRQVVTQATPPSRTASQNMQAHNVPQSPASLGVHNPAGDSASASHNVPRPPERNSSVATPSASTYNSQTGSHTVPKPPYAGSPAPRTNTTAEQHNPSTSPSPYGHSAPTQQQPSHTSQPPASSNHSTPSGNSKEKESKPKDPPKSGSGMASANVPRPPASYSNRATPAYSASSYAGHNGSYGGSTSSYGASTSPYATSPNSYGAPATAYRAPGSYSAAPTYTARANAPAAPHYSAPSASHYSTGGGGGHYSSGGSTGRSSSSGGHSGGHGR